MRFIALLALSLVSAGRLSTQPQAECEIQGFVTGDPGGNIANAVIGVDNLSRQIHRQTVTDSSGHYVIANLEPGGYSAWAEVKGYGCIIYPNVSLFSGDRVRQDFHFVRPEHIKNNCAPKPESSRSR
jgi:hypothetical protein